MGIDINSCYLIYYVTPIDINRIDTIISPDRQNKPSVDWVMSTCLKMTPTHIGKNWCLASKL